MWGAAGHPAVMGTWRCRGAPRGDGNPQMWGVVGHLMAMGTWGCCGAPHDAGDTELRVLWRSLGTWGCCGEPRGDGDPRNVTHCGAGDPECWGCCGVPYGDGDLRVLWGTPLRWGPTEVKCYMAHHTDGDLEKWGSCGAPWGAGGSLGNPVVMGVRWDPRAAAGTWCAVES